jgi:hypothetical protein
VHRRKVSGGKEAARRRLSQTKNLRLRYSLKRSSLLGPKTWDAARQTCQAMGMDLPVISTLAHNDALLAGAGDEQIWLGLSNFNGGEVGDWTWVNGGKRRPLLLREPPPSPSPRRLPVIPWVGRWPAQRHWQLHPRIRWCWPGHLR